MGETGPKRRKQTSRGMEMARIFSKTAVAAMLVGIPALGFAQDAGFGFSPEQASSGTDVPQAEMSLGMRPVANDLIFVAGIKQGFFGEDEVVGDRAHAQAHFGLGNVRPRRGL